MNNKEMFDNWMKKKEEIQLRIERTDKMVKDREKEITLLENQISYLEETIDSFMDEPDIVIKKLQAENVERTQWYENEYNKRVELEKQLMEALNGTVLKRYNEEKEVILEQLKSCIVVYEEQKDRLIKKLEVAVEALKFYADRMSYSLDDYEGISGEMRSRVVLYGDSIEVNDVSSHAGHRATEALKKINED